MTNLDFTVYYNPAYVSSQVWVDCNLSTVD